LQEEVKGDRFNGERTVEVMLSDVKESADVVDVRRAAAESMREPMEDFMILRECLCDEMDWRVDEISQRRRPK